jgi:hypothetical protein
MTLKRTGIKRGTKKLTRSTRLQSRGLIGREWAIKPVRPKYDPAERPARAGVRDRSGGMCELQIPGVCEGRATNYQHRMNQSQQGQYAIGSGLDVCGSGTTGCHGYIHDHPEESYRKGWSVKSWDNPLTRPVLYRGQWVVLDDLGSFTPSLPFEEAS